MEIYVSYDKKTKNILDFFPTDTPETQKSTIAGLWKQTISREILLALSLHEELSTARLKETVGHSLSTLHENVRRLEEAGIVTTRMTYKDNKQKMLKTNVIFITDNPTNKQRFSKFFQGIWIDNDSAGKIISFLNKNPATYYTQEQISQKTHIPLSEVKIILSNLESPITRGFSEFMKNVPFEKKILYRAKKNIKTEKISEK